MRDGRDIGESHELPSTRGNLIELSLSAFEGITLWRANVSFRIQKNENENENSGGGGGGSDKQAGRRSASSLRLYVTWVSTALHWWNGIK